MTAGNVVVADDALRDATVAHEYPLQGVTTGAQPLLVSKKPDLDSLKTVTLLTCSRCHRRIDANETVYRPHYTFCERCFPIERDLNKTGIFSHRYKWLSHPVKCEVCTRTVIHPAVNYDRQSRARCCSSTCDSRLYRDRKRSVVTCSCGTDFKQRRKDQLHCSSACKQRAYRERRS